MRIISVVGARPNFMKIAPIARAIKQIGGMQHKIVHTGQHYDYKMSASFFKELGIPAPDINLGIGSGPHGEQTGKIMAAFEKVCLKHKPDVVLVVGDVNSTMACSIVASKLRIPSAHVEAGLRSRDRNMPEEINRLVTDSVADVLFTTSIDADKNLMKEGIPKDRIYFVGNVMIDTLKHNYHKAKKSKIIDKLNLKPKGFALVTLHRPSNVDSKKTLKEIVDALAHIQKDIEVVFPVHPRTLKYIKKFVSKAKLKKYSNLKLIEPLGYFDFMHLVSKAKLVITDSGGIQEETTVLGIPCLTVRHNTERPVTITEGTNVLVGPDKNRIIRQTAKVIKGKYKKGRTPKYWDGKASLRIIKIIRQLHKQKRLLRS